MTGSNGGGRMSGSHSSSDEVRLSWLHTKPVSSGCPLPTSTADNSIFRIPHMVITDDTASTSHEEPPPAQCQVHLGSRTQHKISTSVFCFPRIFTWKSLHMKALSSSKLILLYHMQRIHHRASVRPNTQLLRSGSKSGGEQQRRRE